jgi:CDP-6-deoxy-D-xylo-4-hexulose-3-dehydrase
MTASKESLRAQILALVREYHYVAWPAEPFTPGRSSVPVSGRVFDEEEVVHLVDASLDFWLTTGRYAEQFERELAGFLGVREVVLCNSGSSANLLAICALTSRSVERRLQPGDEVITAACGFPTTVNAILLNNLVPVYVDVELGTYNATPGEVEAAIGEKTRAIMLAHTLGNPFEVQRIREIADRHGLWLIEDNCDALGSRHRGRLTGTFGHLATHSFYPAHHITMGEGGAVATNTPKLKVNLESFRDWGRACWCAPGCANTCGRRFDWQLGSLPHGYDHKYIYSHIGYNLKATDMQAAVGVAQLAKLPAFIEVRKRNWAYLADALAPFEEYFVLPRATDGSDPSWFGFALTVRPDARFTRHALIGHLQERRVETRLLFGGNLLRQPAYCDTPHRVAGNLSHSDAVMSGTFWVGVYPALGPDALDYVVETIARFIKGR